MERPSELVSPIRYFFLTNLLSTPFFFTSVFLSMRLLFSSSFSALLLLVGSVVAAPVPNPMPASPPAGSIRMVAPANSAGGVQLGGNQQVYPHIVVGRGPGPHEVHVAPVSHKKNVAFNPHRPQGNFARANSGPNNVAAINQANQNEHTVANLNAAHHHTLAADSHRQAHYVHTTAANRHEGYARAHPAQAQVHNSAAQQHRAQAAMHQNKVAFHGAQAQHHRAMAHNAPWPGSLGAAHNSANNAQQSQRAADASRNQAQSSGRLMDAPQVSSARNAHNSVQAAHGSAPKAQGSAQNSRNALHRGK